MAPRASLEGLTAAGQLHTNVRDLARWITFHLGAGPASDASVLAPETLAEAQQTLWVQPDFLLGQGLGWRMVRVGDHVFHNHGGSVHGFNSSVGFHVPTGIGVVVLANLWPALVAGELALELLEAIVGGPRRRPGSVGGSLTGMAAHPRRRADDPPAPAPEHVRHLLGRYLARPGIVMHVEWRRGSLQFAAPAGGYSLHAPAALEPVDGATDMVRVVDGRGAGEDVQFLPGPDGRASSFALGGFVYRRAD